MTDTCVIDTNEADKFLRRLFMSCGLGPEDAALAAADMVLTNLWGIDSHGLLRLPIYAQRLKNGAINPTPNIQTVAGHGAFETVDGDAGLGFVVGHHAMARAIDLAKSHGIGAVTVRNSNHFGAAGLYIKQATEAGMVALCMTSVGPNLVVPGGAKPITGNNPLAFGAPTGQGFPLILDISMSAVAGGKLLLAQEKGEKIPLGWATDKEGRPTDDPTIGFAGFLLPLGGHKGFGLSLMVDILCGVLSGGAYQFDLKSMYKSPDDPSETGHMMIVIDPAAAIGRSEFVERMEAFCATVKASPMWDQTARMLIPGELEHEKMQERLATGLELPDSLWREIEKIAADRGVEMPHQFTAPAKEPSS